MQKATKEKPLCPLHQKKLKIVCANPLCKKPRFCCTKCLYDPIHSDCITKTILFEDLAQNKFMDQLKNWVESDSDRKRLNEISEIIIPKIESNLALILKKIDELKSIFLEEIEVFFKVLKEKIRENEALRLYQAHFSISQLKTLLLKEKNLEEMNHFFSINSHEFLKVFDNPDYNIALSFEKTQITKHFSEKNQQIREIFPDFLAIKLNFPEFLPKKPIKNVLKLGNPIHKIIRFRKHEGSIWTFDRKYPDYISFEANKNLRIYGFGMYKTRTIGHKWKVLGQIIEGGESNGKVLQKKDFVFINTLENHQEMIAKLLFDPVDLPAKSLLTLYIWAVGQDTLGGMEGSALIKNEKDKVEFKFANAKVKETDNGTTIKVGQIPEIYYSVLDD